MSGVLTLPFLCLVLFNAPDMACQASQASRLRPLKIASAGRSHSDNATNGSGSPEGEIYSERGGARRISLPG
jgi:hypothetical protein